MKLTPLILIAIICLATAQAATTNINNNRINTYDIFSEGHMAIGSTWNNTIWQLFVANDTLIESDLVANDSILAGVHVYAGDTLFAGNHIQSNGTLYVENTATFNGAIVGIDKTELPSDIAYEDEANTFAIRQAFLDGISVAANAYFTGVLTVNNTGIFSQLNIPSDAGCLYYGVALDVNLCRVAANLLQTGTGDALDVTGTFIASTRGYHEGIAAFNSTVGIGTTSPTSLLTTMTTATQDTLFDISSSATGANGNFVEMRARQENDAGTAGSGSTIRFAQTNVGGGTWDSQLIFLVRDDTALMTALTIDPSNSLFAAAIEIDGALNHDGSTVGLYGKAPVVQHADIPNMVDNTGGTISSTCAAIAAGALYAQGDMVAAKNCLASLIAKINLLEAAIEEIGITA